MKFAEVLANPEFTSPKSHAPITAMKSRQSSDIGGDCLSPIVAKDGYYELTAKIPCPVVGLLLVRRSADPNIIHQIRQYTSTMILKVECDSGTEGNELELQDEKYSSGAKFNPRGYEIFSVRGKEADVVLAGSCLARIVEGEKIFSVMNELKLIKGSRSDDQKRDVFDSSRGRGGRATRGRGSFATSRGGHTSSSHDREVRSEVEDSELRDQNSTEIKDEHSTGKPEDGEEDAGGDEEDSVGEQNELGSGVNRGRGGRRNGRTIRGRGFAGRASTRGHLRERGRGVRGRRGTWSEE